jgi:hypothetical protein
VANIAFDDKIPLLDEMTYHNKSDWSKFICGEERKNYTKCTKAILQPSNDGLYHIPEDNNAQIDWC